MAITAAQLQVKIGADTSEAERAMQSVSDRLTSFGTEAAKIGGLLTLGVTTPLAGVAKAALGTAMDYQSALNLMQAVSGATAEQMQQVSERAKELGADMSLPATSAADAATAMTELAKAGLSVEQSMAAAKGVLQLSAAGGISNAAAAEIAANALNAFGLSGDQAANVANLLAAAANASSAEVTDVADALRMASAVFASAGVPIEELVASIGQMANAGIKGSDAGTSLKQMLLSLQAPTDKAAKLMDSLGITIYDAQGNMLPFDSIIEQFSTKLGGLSQEQRNAALATIFGSDAVRAANVVLMQGAEAHNQMLQAVTRQGAAADLAGARMKGLGGALQGLQSQVETVLLEVAEPFLQTLEGWVRGLADLVPKITELDPSLRNAALAFAAVLAAAGPVILAFGALATAIGFLLSPVGLVVVAIAALAAAWTTNFLGIRDITASALAAVSNVVQAVIGFVAPFIQREFGVVVAWWQANLPLMQRTVETVMNAIRGVVNFVLTQVQAFWQAHGDRVIAILSAAWTMIETVIDTAIHTVLDIITLVMQIITGDWEGAWETIKGIGERLWEAIKTI
ncbi:MAG TPA: phage tail tape measure protein, partial [Candidatus Acidoferrales bacterium]|nr:phage tail tape measure protein [Candidatus Acidoferrales bacterium]